ncbi:PTS system D-mannitol-specific IIA component, Fru family /PTS system D-mannitol-specific IIB component, Fru family /PTS system D-mannitol-specific IIC component, Fru family [Georgenia satyanarayanai]|uniref:Mannitol-specific phosphotransferase enzyme IIA component n=1 Tax=Georgenia satyanarayanai TaxID=860221 RepID=A0A2Y9ABY9_9MICO|nr:PTS mannitol transporter subunit IICBA [Georgenia satyanarayanai]PYG00446.1 PTS system D-mannitol-specific IIA component (Fru family) /PTS system D-mannitol-specific IIB component (Fru family) /PTS system D-mannitol-specific IIC component (Fru family) [Georgenia satyanarayanai]SSA39827.1 PTS system D-mannitol-specific IIA component, Fru family /PTS system D-mannitol-specific IIB component, Fru family /PTS system D-mannitol-specific IIC component, Fru family [Georgenia satyanarayanai]
MSAPTDVRPDRGSAGRERGGLRVAVQKLGTALSNMVLPNIAAFIAWGLITALFIEVGWITLIGENVFGYEGGYGLVERLGGWGAGAEAGGIVAPMITYLLPLLIGYTGGRMLYDDNIRGGVVGAIATMGAITGAGVPMFLGAMVMGPLGGWSMKKLDALWADRIRPGFEMLVNNFSAGIWGMILAILGFVAAGPFVEAFSNAAGNVVRFLVDNSLLPLTSILVEPAKILFLNNAINHGIFTPLGTTEAITDGQSILFLIEANPGPGLGLLLAFAVFGTGLAKASAPGAALIQFVGGIHEIYFPYVLMKPRLILAVIAGGMTGVATNLVFGSGLRAPAAPGSIIAVLIQSPVGSLVGVILSVVLSALVTFLVAAVLLRTGKDDDADLAGATERMEEMKGKRSSVAGALTGGGVATATRPIGSIVFACDAGMGSSAMGASVLRRKIRDAGYEDVTVVNKAISSLRDDADLVVTHRDLTDRARQRTPSAVHVSVEDFMASPRYDEVVALVGESRSAAEPTEPAPSSSVPATAQPAASMAGPATGAGTSAAPEAGAAPAGGLLAVEAIVLEGRASSKAEAISEAGGLLVASGAVPAAYVEAMHEREESVSTHMGSGLAIPHGTNEAKGLIARTAISFVRYPQGLDWDGKDTEFVIGVAGAGDDHLQVLSRVAEVFLDESQVARLRAARTAEEVQAVLSES